MKHAPITSEQSRQIVDIREDKSMSAQQIARKLGLHHGAVTWHLLKLGIEKVGKPPANYKPESPERYTYMRGGRLVRGFTLEQDAKLRRLEAEGLSYIEIGRRMGRKQNSIRGRLHTLGRSDQRLDAGGAA
jgi:IS30 family transposase